MLNFYKTFAANFLIKRSLKDLHGQDRLVEDIHTAEAEAMTREEGILLSAVYLLHFK